jgi:hypothetical protein
MAMPSTLGTALAAAVPLRIVELASSSDEQRLALVAGTVDTICTHGDDLLFGGKHCKETFAALVRALAVAAYQPGGITFAGRHWCAAYCDCPTAARQGRDVPPSRPPDPRPPDPPPVVTIATGGQL